MLGTDPGLCETDEFLLSKLEREGDFLLLHDIVEHVVKPFHLFLGRLALPGSVPGSCAPYRTGSGGKRLGLHIVQRRGGGRCSEQAHTAVPRTRVSARVSVSLSLSPIHVVSTSRCSVDLAPCTRQTAPAAVCCVCRESSSERRESSSESRESSSLPDPGCRADLRDLGG